MYTHAYPDQKVRRSDPNQGVPPVQLFFDESLSKTSLHGCPHEPVAHELLPLAMFLVRRHCMGGLGIQDVLQRRSEKGGALTDGSTNSIDRASVCHISDKPREVCVLLRSLRGPAPGDSRSLESRLSLLPRAGCLENTRFSGCSALLCESQASGRESRKGKRNQEEGTGCLRCRAKLCSESEHSHRASLRA